MTGTPPATQSSTVCARELREAECDAWCAVLGRSSQGGVYGRPEYLAAVCEATGAGGRIVGVFLNDQLVGGVPLSSRRFTSQLGGDLTVTLSITRPDSWMFRVSATARHISTSLRQRLRGSQVNEAA